MAPQSLLEEMIAGWTKASEEPIQGPDQPPASTAPPFDRPASKRIYRQMVEEMIQGFSHEPIEKEAWLTPPPKPPPPSFIESIAKSLPQLPPGTGYEGFLEAPSTTQPQIEEPQDIGQEQSTERQQRFRQELLDLLKNWTIGPFIEGGRIAREGRTTEQAKAFETMTPEQRAAYEESGRGKQSILTMTRDDPALQEIAARLLTLGMVGAGGHIVGGPRFGAPKTTIPFIRPKTPEQPVVEPPGPVLQQKAPLPPEILTPPPVAPLPTPTQTFTGKTYAERRANAAQVLDIPQSELKADIKKLIKSKEANTGDEALAMIAERRKPSAPPEGQVVPQSIGASGLSPAQLKTMVDKIMYANRAALAKMTPAKIEEFERSVRERLMSPAPLESTIPPSRPVAPPTAEVTAAGQLSTQEAPKEPVPYQPGIVAEAQGVVGKALPYSPKYQKSPIVEPTEGFIRLYRGTKAETTTPGQWFSTDPAVAKVYAEPYAGGKPGRLDYVDVPKAYYKDLLEEARIAGDVPEHLFVDNATAGKARPVESGKVPPPVQPKAAVAPTIQPTSWSGRIDKRAPSALKSRAAEVDTLDAADFASGGKFDYLAQLKLIPKDEANRVAANMVIHFENRSLNPNAVNPSTKDFGLFQFSPTVAGEVGVKKGGTPADHLKRFEKKWLPELERRIGSNDPKALALGHLNQKWTKQAVAKGGAEPSTVGAAQYKAPPYEPEQLATGPGAPDLPPDISMKVLAKSGYESLGLQVEQLFRGELPNPDARFFRNVGAAVKRGDIVFPGQRQLLEQHGLTAEMLGDDLMKTATHSGQTLNLYSQWSKKVQRFARENPELAKEMNIALPPPREPLGWFRKLDNTTRATMTGRIGTAMRNLEQGVANNIFDAFDNAIANVVVGAKQGNIAQEMAASTERFSAMFRALSPAKQKELSKLLDAFPLQKMELLSAPIQDVVYAGKFVKIVQTWNWMQERFVRRLALDGSVSEEMARRGLQYDRANLRTVPEDIMDKGVADALRITYAARPEKGTVPGFISSRILRMYDPAPVLSLINPFPRFQYANAFRFIWEHSPFGPIDLMTKGKLAQEVTSYSIPTKAARAAQKQLAIPNATITSSEFDILTKQAQETTTISRPTMAAKAAQAELANPKTAVLAYTKAATGLGLFTAALAYRSSDDAPDKWYEVKAPSGVPVIGGKAVSGEAFAPFITYGLFAETFRLAVDQYGTQEMKEMFNTIKKPPVVEAKDVARAMIGLNRIAGTGLVFVDLLQKGGWEGWLKHGKDFFGQYIGRFTVPLSSYKNLVSPVVPEEATIRDVTTAPLTGPTRRNIPGVSEALPPSPSITRAEPRMIEHPVFGELTGLSAQTYTQLEHEVNRLNIPWYELGPRTGVPEADLKLKKYMGQLLDDKTFTVFLESNDFQKATDPQKERQLRKEFGNAKRAAMGQLHNEYPALYDQVQERLHRKDLELLESLRGQTP